VSAPSQDWWRDAVVYQDYLRSFADSSGDGIGDVAGLRSRLPYLAWLGVDALWINPHCPSGDADGGYDIVDYRAVDPDYGDLKALIDDANQLGLRALKVVHNHTSYQHPRLRPGRQDAARIDQLTRRKVSASYTAHRRPVSGSTRACRRASVTSSRGV
jgi:alpha-glucosidase